MVSEGQTAVASNNEQDSTTSTTVVGRRLIHSGGIGVKQLPPRSWDKKWKIKWKNPNAKNIEVKHRGNIVRKMTVCRRAIYPSFKGGVY